MSYARTVPRTSALMSRKEQFVRTVTGKLLTYAIGREVAYSDAPTIRAIVRARKRRALDWAMKYFLTGVILLLPLCIIGLVLSWPNLPLNATTGQFENAYGCLALVGVISMAIVGMLYKIVPFLVWQTIYSKQIGLRKVPSLAELYSHRLQAWGYWSFIVGLAVALAGILASHSLLARCGAGAIAQLESVLVIDPGNVDALRGVRAIDVKKI